MEKVIKDSGTKNFKACINCKSVFDKFYTPDNKCKKCGGKLTQRFRGLVGIVNPEKSKVAKFLNITEQGMYAISLH